MRTDILVVGAGSAGAVLAARLSEDPRRRVLLLEAGADHPDMALMPPDLLDARGLGAMAHDWGYSAEALPGRRIAYRRGRVVGGTSAINAAAALWPRPYDMEAWAAAGATGWGWDQVRPLLQRIEHDLDFPAPPHGRAGPLPIVRYRDDELIPFQAAFAEGCREAGLPRVADHNAEAGGGVGPWPMNRDGQVRMSTLLAYLAPARGRGNLSIRAGAVVDRVVVEQGCAVGVVLAGGEEIAAGRVVLAAGAIGSPAILLRSGIGPAAGLARHGIPLVLDCPGVGARMWEHPAVHVRLVPPAGDCVAGRDPRFQVFARTQGDAGAADALVLNPVTFVDVSAMAAVRAEAGVDSVAVIAAALMRPRGHGRLALASTDPLAAPEIVLDLCREEDDLRRLVACTRSAYAVATSGPMRAVMRGVVGLDDAAVSSDSAVADYVRANVVTFNHPAGTVPMGRPDDPHAVLDPSLAVRGVQGLFVADASIMPVIPRAVPNLTCMMIGERAAELLDAQ